MQTHETTQTSPNDRLARIKAAAGLRTLGLALGAGGIGAGALELVTSRGSLLGAAVCIGGIGLATVSALGSGNGIDQAFSLGLEVQQTDQQIANPAMHENPAGQQG